MIDIYGDGKPNDEVDWTESDFSPDFLSMGEQKYDTIQPYDDYEEYSNPETRRRRKKPRRRAVHPSRLPIQAIDRQWRADRPGRQLRHQPPPNEEIQQCQQRGAQPPAW
ncbi:MAG: hypothetical protein VCF08_18890 [Alphaproteobacteria bacterium]